MSDVWLDRLWMAVAFALVAAATFGSAWAIAGDAIHRARASRTGNPTPRRCGKCWYDMTGVPGLCCPECGWVATSEQGLRRPRRRWRMAAASCLLLLPAWMAWNMPVVRQHGWATLVPMVVLVSWPMDVDAWTAVHPTDWAGKELDKRRDAQLFDRVSERILAWRVQARWTAVKGPGDEVAVIDTSLCGADERRLVEYDGWGCCGYTPPPPSWQPTWEVDRKSRKLRTLITQLIDTDGWTDNGGDKSRIADLGTRIVVAGSHECVERVRGLVSLLGQAQSRDSMVDWQGMSIVGLDWCGGSDAWSERCPEELGRALRGIVVECVCRDAWTDNGGDAASITCFDGRIIIMGPSDIRARARAVIDAMREALIHGTPGRLGAFATASLPGTKPEFVALWPLRNLTPAWRLDDEPEVCGQAHGELEVGPYPDNTPFMRLRKAVSTRLERTAPGHWTDEGGDDASHVWSESLAMLWTTQPALIDMVEQELRAAAAGPRDGE